MINYTELYGILHKTNHFKSLSKLHRKRLVLLISKMFRGDFTHNRISTNGLIGNSIHSSLMKKEFRRNDDNGYYKKVIKPYVECINESYSFNGGENSYTKKYILKDWIYDKCFDYWRNNTDPIEISLIGKNVIPIMTVPSNGVVELDSEGNTKSSTIYINPIVEMNSDTLNKTIDELETVKSKPYRKWVKRNNLIHLYGWKHTLNNTLTPNKVIQLYQESQNGRLNPLTSMSIQHIISTPQRIRRVLFDGMNLWDYDMSNSHLSIFYGLCERYGFNCPYIGEYNNNKNYYRDTWSERFHIETNKIKPYIISWLYGNTNHPHKGNPFFKTLDYLRMKKIRNDEMLMGIYNEIDKGRKLIIDNQKTKNDRLVNVMNKDYPKGNKVGSTLCFILFGYESKILQVVNEMIGDKMKVLIYDGWIGEKVDVSLLEETVKQRLDINIRFKEHKIERTDTFTLS